MVVYYESRKREKTCVEGIKIFGTGYDSFELASSDMTGVCLDVVCHSDTDGNSPKDDGRT